MTALILGVPDPVLAVLAALIAAIAGAGILVIFTPERGHHRGPDTWTRAAARLVVAIPSLIPRRASRAAGGAHSIPPAVAPEAPAPLSPAPGAGASHRPSELMMTLRHPLASLHLWLHWWDWPVVQAHWMRQYKRADRKAFAAECEAIRLRDAAPEEAAPATPGAAVQRPDIDAARDTAPLGSLVVPLEHPLMPGRPRGQATEYRRPDAIIAVGPATGGLTRTAIYTAAGLRRTQACEILDDGLPVARPYVLAAEAARDAAEAAA